MPIIPLKGMLLSKRLYGDIISRDQSVDLDLLIKEEDKEIAISLLKDIGYELKIPEELGEECWFYIFNRQNSKMIELHWDITLMCRSKDRINGLWEGTERSDLEGVKYYDLKTEELLLYLSTHLVNSDTFKQLRYITDINTLLMKYSDKIDWDSMIHKAYKWNMAGSLYIALRLNKEFFGSSPKNKVLEKIKLSPIKKTFIHLSSNKEVYFEKGIRRKILDNFLSYIYLELVEGRTILDYCHVFKRVIFPPRETLKHGSYLKRILEGIPKVLTKNKF